MEYFYAFKNFYQIESFQKSILLDKIFYSKKIHDNSNNSGPQTNVLILSKDPILDSLYLKFLFQLNKIFGPLQDLIFKENYFAYCTNKNYWKFVPHNHIRTSTLHCVYYLNIPKDLKRDEGGIDFFIKGEWQNYMPSENELIIMPNHLEHSVCYHSSEEYRVSINMEIFCRPPNHFWFNN